DTISPSTSASLGTITLPSARIDDSNDARNLSPVLFWSESIESIRRTDSEVPAGIVTTVVLTNSGCADLVRCLGSGDGVDDACGAGVLAAGDAPATLRLLTTVLTPSP